MPAKSPKLSNSQALGLHLRAGLADDFLTEAQYILDDTNSTEENPVTIQETIDNLKAQTANWAELQDVDDMFVPCVPYLSIGDIVVYTEEGEYQIVKKDEFTGNEGTPIAIVAIPEGLSPIGKTHCISLKIMDAANAKEGFADNLFKGSTPSVTATYIDKSGTDKGSVTLNVGYKDASANYYEFTGWNGRVNYSGGVATPDYIQKVVTDFDTPAIGDIVRGRYVVASQIYRFSFMVPTQGNSLTPYSTFPTKDGAIVTLEGQPAGSTGSIKGYMSQTYYNPEYTFESGEHYTGGLKDSKYPEHYWYDSVAQDTTGAKLAIPSPVKKSITFNSVWNTAGTITSDFDGKGNTAKLVAQAKAGVANSANELIKWDGTPESLWAPYKLTGPSSDCTNGYGENGKVYTSTQTYPATTEWYMFPCNYNNSGSIENYWNYSALTCNCYAPTGSGTNPGDWYCPAAGELGFALAFAEEINRGFNVLKAKGIACVGLTRPTLVDGVEKFSQDATSPNFTGNEYGTQQLNSSTTYDGTKMISMYIGHAYYYNANTSTSSATRAFIQI